MPNDSHRPDVAVFIDFENVYVSVRDKLDANPNFEMIMDRVEDFGRVVIARAYADWYRYPRVTSALYANNIEPMYVPTYYYPAYAFFPGTFVQTRQLVHQQFSTMGLGHGRK